MSIRRIGRLPIVERQDSRRLIGVLRRQDIIQAYERAIANRKDLSSRLRELRETSEGKVRVLELDIGRNHELAGRPIGEIGQDLPQNCILVSIRRGNSIIIPHGDTKLQEGDQLVALAANSCVPDIKSMFDTKDA
jgi:Trk K+ transport system NAD-binding subunit